MRKELNITEKQEEEFRPLGTKRCSLRVGEGQGFHMPFGGSAPMR